MEIIADLHMHTLANNHAYNTIEEMACAANETNMKAIAITEHGPATLDAPRSGFFANYVSLPEKINGITLLHGCEAGIISFDGKLDIELVAPHVMKNLDIVIASMHPPTMTYYNNKYDYTNAYLSAIENPAVDILGHVGRYRHPFFAEPVINAAAKNRKVIEINESALSNKNYADYMLEILKKCKTAGVKISVSSDAHCSHRVGKFSRSLKLLDDAGIDENMVINSSIKNLSEFLNNRPGKRKIDL